jgi:beta-1,3-glucuronyltransferase S
MQSIYRSHKSIPRGVSNRRAALSWIKNNNIREGVLYFGDDDNTFDLRLFSEIRFTNRVSMFPVGLIGDYSVSSPIVEKVSES